MALAALIGVVGCGTVVSSGGANAEPVELQCQGEASDVPDFDGDDKPDVAIGGSLAPYNGVEYVGSVELRYGSGEIAELDVETRLRQWDGFGHAVAATNLDGDGFTDLLVGAPGRNVGGMKSAGAVFAFLGSPSGLREYAVLTQGANGVPGQPPKSARFGDTIAASVEGNRPFYVGADNTTVDGLLNAGVVARIRLTAEETPRVDGQLLMPGTHGIPGKPREYAYFGKTLVPLEDGVAIGAPEARVGGPWGGAVYAVYEDDRRPQRVTAWTPGMSGQPAASHEFGGALWSNTFWSDAEPELWIGAPEAEVAGASDAGEVYRVPIRDGKLVPAGAERYTRNSNGIAGRPQSFDEFGHSIVGGPQRVLIDAPQLRGYGTVVEAGTGRSWTQEGAGYLGTGNRFGEELSSTVDRVDAGNGKTRLCFRPLLRVGSDRDSGDGLEHVLSGLPTRDDRVDPPELWTREVGPPPGILDRYGTAITGLY